MRSPWLLVARCVHPRFCMTYVTETSVARRASGRELPDAVGAPRALSWCAPPREAEPGVCTTLRVTLWAAKLSTLNRVPFAPPFHAESCPLSHAESCPLSDSREPIVSGSRGGGGLWMGENRSPTRRTPSGPPPQGRPSSEALTRSPDRTHAHRLRHAPIQSPSIRNEPHARGLQKPALRRHLSGAGGPLAPSASLAKKAGSGRRKRVSDVRLWGPENHGPASCPCGRGGGAASNPLGPRRRAGLATRQPGFVER